MKENKFKVGDRVACYGIGTMISPGDAAAQPIERVEPIEKTGVIASVSNAPREGVLVSMQCGNVWFHPKQCRRLVPKKKKPGYEIWLNWDPEHYNDSRYVRNVMSMANGVISVVKKDGWIKYKRCK